MTGGGVVVVTGAAGFIGQACVAEFAARGYEVVALVHRRELPPSLDGRERGAVHEARADTRDPRALSEALRPWRGRIQALVHCAGHASDLGPERLFRETNLEGVRRVCQFLAGEPGARLVHLSTTDVYGLRDFDGAGEETPLDARPLNPYPRYKILAEEAIRELLPPERVVILRPGAVWGPGDKVILPRVLAHLRHAPAVVHFGRWKGRNRWPATYVGTVARAARVTAEAPAAPGRAYNVVDPEPMDADGYFRTVLETCLPEKAHIPSWTLPLWTGWAMGAVSTGLARLLRRSRPLFEPTLYGLRSASFNLDFDGSRLHSLLASRGESPVSQPEALDAFRAWWQQYASLAK